MRDLSVLLVDNKPLFAQLLTRFLQSEEQARVVAVSTSESNILAKVREISPAVVLIDLDLSVKNSLDSITRIRTVLPDALIIAITLMDTVYYRKVVQDAGADEILLKMDLNSNFLIYLHSRIDKRNHARSRAIQAAAPKYPGVDQVC